VTGFGVLVTESFETVLLCLSSPLVLLETDEGLRNSQFETRDRDRVNDFRGVTDRDFGVGECRSRGKGGGGAGARRDECGRGGVELGSRW